MVQSHSDFCPSEFDVQQLILSSTQSMAETDIWVMSMAAVFAASKSEDNPRALQDIIYHGLRPERVGATIKPSRTKLFAKTKADPQARCV